MPSHGDITALTGQGFRVIVGPHPKIILADVERQTVKALIQHQEVSGLGEVGLDHTSKPDLWHIQERQLKDLLDVLGPAKVLTLHQRGMKDDPTGVDVFVRCPDVISPLPRGS